MKTAKVRKAHAHLDKVFTEHNEGFCACEKIDVWGRLWGSCPAIVEAKRALADAVADAVGLFQAEDGGRLVVYGPGGFACEQASGEWWVFRRYLDNAPPVARLPASEEAAAMRLIGGDR